MESKTERSSQLITRRDSMNLDDTMQDADEETFQNHNIIVVKSKCGRGMGLEYSKVTTVTDFPAAKIYMSENMPTYKWRCDKETGWRQKILPVQRIRKMPKNRSHSYAL